MKLKKDTIQDGYTIDREGAIVVCRLRGRLDKPLMVSFLKEVAEQQVHVALQHRDVYLLVDVEKITGTDSAARLTAKNVKTSGFKRVAVFGTNRLIMSIGQYVVRSSKGGISTKFFKTESEARKWLADGRQKVSSRPVVGLLGGFVVAAIGIAGLVGWQLSNPHLTRFMLNLRPINPLAAVGLVVMGVGFIAFWAQKRQPQYLTGCFAVVLGVAALLPLSIDDLLYGDRVAHAGAYTALADSAAICFIAVGMVSLLSYRSSKAIKWLQYVCVLSVLGLALFNIYGQLYAHDYIYGISQNFVMAFNLAVAFLIAGITMTLIGIGRRVGTVVGLVSRAGWLIIPALILVQILTYAVWQQEIHRNETESGQAFNQKVDATTDLIKSHIQGYTDALTGYQGFFQASSSVTQADFQAYFDALNLAQRYPGLRSIVYVRQIPTKDIPRFVTERKKDTTLFPAGNPGYSVSDVSSGGTHYFAAYNPTSKQPLSATRDLASSPGRQGIYDKAIASGQPVASGPVVLQATATQKKQSGFFIAVPTKTEDAKDYSGIVIAVFNYADFFPTLLTEQKVARQPHLKITDAGTKIFETKDMVSSHRLSVRKDIDVAGRSWLVQGEAAQNFGLSSGQSDLPVATLLVGQLFSLLLIVIFISQSRSRDRAVRLAEEITKDLNQERDDAIAVQQKDDAILSSIGDAVFAIDKHDRLTLFNPVAAQMSGYSQEEALGQPYQNILKFVHEATGKVNDVFVRQALQGKITSMKNHTALIRKDGTHVPVADSAAPIRDANHKIIGVIVVFRDVTKDQQLDRAKTEFVSLASHQLRTPLSAINWYSEMLINGDAGKITADQRTYLQEIFDGNQRMIELVNSLLDVSRLDLGKFTNEPRATSLAETVDSLERELNGSITAKKIKFSKTMSKLPPLQIDPKLLRMIIQNLLSNAVKYTPASGSVSLVVRPATAAEATATALHKGAYVRLEVRDTGCGIPAGQQSKIFSKLFRADNVQSMDVEGTGLGLYIVKEVVDRLGGHVSFTSKENQGTTFIVILPEVTTGTETA